MGEPALTVSLSHGTDKHGRSRLAWERSCLHLALAGRPVGAHRPCLPLLVWPQDNLKRVTLESLEETNTRLLRKHASQRFGALMEQAAGSGSSEQQQAGPDS